MTPERDAVTRAREAIIKAIVERTMAALQTEGGAKVLLGDVLDAYRAALLAEVVAVVEAKQRHDVAAYEGAMYPCADGVYISRYNTLTAIRALTEAR